MRAEVVGNELRNVGHEGRGAGSGSVVGVSGDDTIQRGDIDGLKGISGDQKGMEEWKQGWRVKKIVCQRRICRRS